jgi:hypothetical protein
MIIATFVKKETEVGITIAHPPLYAEGTETGSPSSGGSAENIEHGNTTEKHNGNETKTFIVPLEQEGKQKIPRSSIG